MGTRRNKNVSITSKRRYDVDVILTSLFLRHVSVGIVFQYSTLSISRGHLFQITHERYPTARLLGRGIGCLCEFKVWIKFYLFRCWSLCDSVLYSTAIYREFIVTITILKMIILLVLLVIIITIPDSNVSWPNVGPTSVLSSRRWANVSPTFIVVWECCCCRRRCCYYCYHFFSLKILFEINNSRYHKHNRGTIASPSECGNL